MRNIDPDKFFLATFIAWVIGVIVSLATLVAIACVAWHFISEFW